MTNTNSILTLLAGLAIGATLGILLAPASGKETRSKLMKRGEGLRDDLADLMEEGKDALNEMKDKATATATNVVDKTKEAANQVKSEVRKDGQAATRTAGASNY